MLVFLHVWRSPSRIRLVVAGGGWVVCCLKMVISGQKKPIPKQLAAYVFKKGDPNIPHGGRPKGSRDAATLYLESLPLKARQWVKSTAPAVLIDARKIALPIESDSPVDRSSLIVGFLERQLSVPLTLSATSCPPTG